MRPGIHRLSLLSATALILIAGQAGAQTKPADSGLLVLDRVFASKDFAAERFGPAPGSLAPAQPPADCPQGQEQPGGQGAPMASREAAAAGQRRQTADRVQTQYPGQDRDRSP
ncbi:MAG: hypothetical protein HGA94_04445, partial [Candidatus Aminicenantes bacterium]|nr:hypothetical protein [Candidatus Aminicenantes bacterium]